MHKISIITGPTSGGKSALALDIALKENGVIINADALQLYKGLPILTACPNNLENEMVPHRLYEILDHTEQCTAGIWANLAAKEIETVLHNGQKPFVVGGSGFYLMALIQGLSEIPDTDPAMRMKLKEDLTIHGLDYMYKNLELHDPIVASKLHPHDQQRIMRGLEVYYSTLKPLSYWQNLQKKTFPYTFDVTVLCPEREQLYQNCNKRFLKMLEMGAIDEVKNLMQQNITETASITQALGFKELKLYVEGCLTLKDAIERAQIKTRQFAKRQTTWCRHQLQNARWIKPI
jgi:tRNA dimethylallyltransferase